MKMVSPVERRKRLAQVDRRAWELWSLSLLTTVALTAGMVVFLLPALSGEVRVFGRQYQILPQLVVGLVTLIVLSGTYIVTKQRELNTIRNFIIATFTGPDLSLGTSLRDTLTGALDRSALQPVLKQESMRAEQIQSPFCLALLDIQGFSKINDLEGNLAGDLILRELAQFLQKSVRQTDKVLRYGPDQFLCLLSGTSHAGGETFINRVQSARYGLSRLRTLNLSYVVADCQLGGDAEAVVAQADRDLSLKKHSHSLKATADASSA